MARAGVLCYAPPHEQAPARLWSAQAGCVKIVVATTPFLVQGGLWCNRGASLVRFVVLPQAAAPMRFWRAQAGCLELVVVVVVVLVVDVVIVVFVAVVVIGFVFVL